MAQDKLQEYRERYDDFSDHFSEQRKRQLEDLKFSNPADPQQWDEAVRSARQNSPGGARPCLTFDHTNQYINQVVNDARQNKPGIQVLPADSGADIQTAQSIEGMIRQIEYTSRASIAYDTSIEHAARCGNGWIRVTTEVTNPQLGEQEIRIKSVQDALSCLLSPESIEPDGSDATDGFIETMMSKRAFEKAYGKKIAQTSWDGKISGWYSDKMIRVCEYYQLKTSKSNRIDVVMPDGSQQTHTEDSYWAQAKQIGFQPRVTAQYLKEDRTVEWCLMTGDDIIDSTEILSQWIPLIPVYGNVLWIDGKRYVCGLTRQLMDGQRAKNFERSAEIELISLQPKSPFILPFESVEGFENEWEAANTSNKAYLPYNALDTEGRPLPHPQRLQPPQIPASFVQGAQRASDDMQAAIGMYKSNLGAPSNATSGRAKMQDQREGDTATYHFVDNQRRSIEQVGRIVVNMIPRYYNTQREIRILGLNGDAKAIQINPNAESNHSGKVPSINPASGTYDVRVKAGPAYATMRQEASEALTEIVGKNPQMMAVLGPTWARMQDWPDADKVAKLLLTMAPPQVQAMEQEDNSLPPEAQSIVAGLKSQMEQMQQQMQQMGDALGKAGDHVDQLEADKGDKAGELEIKRIEANTKAYDAITKRLQVVGPLLNPVEVQQLAEETKREAMEQPDPGQPPSESMGIPEQMPDDASSRFAVCRHCGSAEDVGINETRCPGCGTHYEAQEPPQQEQQEPPGFNEQQEQPPQSGGFFSPEQNQSPPTSPGFGDAPLS